MPSVLRIKNPDGTWYEVTALKGDTGITPNLQVGTVTTGNPGTSAEVTITSTPEEPVLNLKIPKGEQGPAGADALCGAVYDTSQYYASEQGSNSYSRESTILTSIETMRQYKSPMYNKGPDKDTSWLF